MISLCLWVSQVMGMDNHSKNVSPLHRSTIESNLTPLEKLITILKEEKIKRGAFVKKIIDDLRECTNGKMVKLSFLTVKTSYWWGGDRPWTVQEASQDINERKTLSIDRKFRSSVYDREAPFHMLTMDSPNSLVIAGQEVNWELFVNSWDSVREKIKFFKNNDIGEKPFHNLPKSLEGVIDYGVELDMFLDTYPSIYQMIRAEKTAKYETKTPRCSGDLRTIENELPFKVVLRAVNHIFESDFYKRFVEKNHPLNKIIQDHLEKIKHKALSQDFKKEQSESESKEYKRSVIYNKILKNMGNIIELMSVFEIDMDKEQCDLPDSVGWKDLKPKDPYYLYSQLYEIFNDLLFLLLSLDDPYSLSDFDEILTQTLVDRFPLFQDLQKNKDILMASYPMRSGMDAFVNGTMAIGSVGEIISIAPKVADLKNSIYYEIQELVSNYNFPSDQNAPKTFYSFKKPPTNSEAENLEDVLLKAYVQDVLNSAHSLILIPDKEGEGMNTFNNLETFKKAIRHSINHNDPLVFEGWRTRSEQADKARLYLESNEFKNEIYTFVISELKNVFKGRRLFPLINVEGQWYFQRPHFMAPFTHKHTSTNENQYNMYLALTESFEALVGQSFHVLNHEGITAGMTTDTVDLSADLSYIDNLYYKVDHLVKIKQEWRDSARRVKIGESIINTILQEYSHLNHAILDSIKNLVVNKYLKQLKDDYHRNIAYGSADSLLKFMHDVTLDLKDILVDLGGSLTYNPLEIYEKQQNSSMPDPTLILWDTTMEVDQGPGFSLMTKYREDIKAGKVVFVLFKSLQKYANLGVGKSKAGAITLVGKKTPFVTNIHTKLMSYGQDVYSQRSDYALMTFFHDRFDKKTNKPLFQDNEKFYYQATRKNAQKIFNKLEASGEKGYMISGGCLFNKKMSKMFSNISYSDTFGFAIPTVTPIDEGPYRFSVGLNPKGLQ